MWYKYQVDTAVFACGSHRYDGWEMNPELLREAGDPNTPSARLYELYQSSPLLHTTISKNPATPPDLLRIFSSHQSKIIRENVAENPNTPLKVLFHLGTQFPVQFLKNPALPLIFLERPNVLEDFPLQLSLKLLGLPNAPEQMLSWAAFHQNKDLRERAARHRNTPVSLLERLAGDLEQSVRSAVVQNPGAALVLRFYYRAGAALGLASVGPYDEAMSPDELARLAAGGGFARYVAARHPNTSAESLELIAQSFHKDELIRLEVSRHPNASKAVLRLLLEDTKSNIRSAAARHPNTDVAHLQLLRRLGASEELTENYAPDLSLRTDELLALRESGHWVKLLLARHPNTPAALLTTFAADPDSELRSFVAQNPNTPNATLEQFAAIQYPYSVLAATAMNPNLSEKTLRHLWNQHRASAEIRRAIVQNPTAKGKFIEEALLWMGDRALRQSAAQHPNAPQELLQLLRRAGATYDLDGYKTPTEPLSQEELEQLFELGGFAKSLAARHPKLPIETMRRFANAGEEWLQTALASNPMLPEELQVELSASKMWVREALAENPNTTNKILAKLGKDHEDVVRWAVSRNPSVTIQILQQMIHDTNEKVRSTVLRRLAR